jgi:hypothetical protein
MAITSRDDPTPVLLPAPNASLESGAPELAVMRDDAVEPRNRDRGSALAHNGEAEPRSPELTGRPSLTLVYGLWLRSWETALSALATGL